ncbi:MAG TPA: HEAT repeat domain-containing protein [Armatimonadota bacterium]|nr:HEAT repeat domain-containing protein [Armatimonadota bacterium]
MARLRDGTPEVREPAASSLGGYPEWGVEPLCGALQDPEVKVRVAAARALERLGDARAVGPLAEALRFGLVDESGRMNRIMGMIRFSAILVLLAGIAVQLTAPQPEGVMIGAIQLLALTVFWKRRRSRSKLRGAIAEALVRIAERQPGPELWCALPDLQAVEADLRAVAADVLEQEGSVRIASWEAVQRIEALTHRLKSLPLAASAPAPDAAVLPVPAGAPTPDPGTLPRVGE